MTFATFKDNTTAPVRAGPTAAAIRHRLLRRPLGRVHWLWLALFLALQIADVLTTNRALTIPGVTEVNPVMAAFQARLGPAWWLPKAMAVAWFAVAISLSRRRWPMFFAVSCCSLVVVINLANL